MKIKFSDENLKQKMLLQELQNSYEVRKLNHITINKTNSKEEKGDLKSRFFNGKIDKNEKKIIDCFV
ncbi:TPA: hypothetical protein ACGI5J_000422 [Clostridioides difficile]|uniref:Uncharacterized protein n=1 Tax=Clostridioides difficile TaxID=1496 RepID=A0AB74QH09_CLODI|nr:hypothetical protein [Clostridioides difficile]MBY2049371.1 hypothetical protein [Clostridioides difficile]MCD8633533.1 hypothetical protein [Clostridioides difficile]MCF2715161.1 hypothetical protein [Clostridioides difficile]MCI4874910.1 hypothetical protein [Clostridioides difficile]MCR1517928.1 hypothetical protein [Clostridioides difficile]